MVVLLEGRVPLLYRNEIYVLLLLAIDSRATRVGLGSR
jgi:hypothetical protein